MPRLVWIAQQESYRKAKEDKLREDAAKAEEKKARQETMRKEIGLLKEQNKADE